MANGSAKGAGNKTVNSQISDLARAPAIETINSMAENAIIFIRFNIANLGKKDPFLNINNATRVLAKTISAESKKRK